MSKKRTSRQRRPAPARDRRAAAPASPSSDPEPVAASDMADPGLRQEYAYVIADLKRIGITAASMFALLAVLALAVT